MIFLASDFTGLIEMMVMGYGCMASWGTAALALVLAIWKATRAASCYAAILTLIISGIILFAGISLMTQRPERMPWDGAWLLVPAPVMAIAIIWFSRKSKLDAEVREPS